MKGIIADIMSDESTSSDPTPRPHVEVVRQTYDALARRDIPAAFSRFAADVEFVQSEEVPWGGTYHGIEGAQAFFARLTGAVTSVVTVDRFIDAGDSVVAIGWTRGTVNATGRRFDVPIAHVWTVTDGQVVRVRFFIDNPTMQASLTPAL